MVNADQHDYLSSFRKHYHAYSNWSSTGSESTKRLILIYCVECGLKGLLMKQARIYKVKDAHEALNELLRSHDFEKMLKELRQIGRYKFPPIRTIHGDDVRPNEYHQLCRYCISPNDSSKEKILKYDSQLEEIVLWIMEGI